MKKKKLDENQIEIIDNRLIVIQKRIHQVQNAQDDHTIMKILEDSENAIQQINVDFDKL